MSGMVLLPASPAAAVQYIQQDVTYDKNGCVANCLTPPKLIYRFGSYSSTGAWQCCTTKTWTAGSGANSTTAKNPCVVGVGWIPDTAAPSPDNQYVLRHVEANYGSAVFGTAWRIHNKLYSGAIQANCDADTPYERTDLLIHSEMTDGHQQTNCSSSDSPTCWEGTGDYYSNGCIKLSFIDIHNNPGQQFGVSPSFDWYWHNRGGVEDARLIVIP